MDPATWILGVLLSIVPPATHRHYETEPEVVDRYEEISEALASVAYDPEERPVFRGDYARAKTALLMLAIARFETGFLRKHELAPSSHGAWCYGQIQIGDGMTRDGWSGPELLADREKCWRATLRVLRRSWMHCGASPELALVAYTAGRCESDLGRKFSAVRVNFANALIAKHRAPVRDVAWMHGDES